MSASATLARAKVSRVRTGPDARAREAGLDSTRELERFLAGVERRAFRIAQIALRDTDDALDAVQDAMLKLATHYAARPADEWRPLFYRILGSRIADQQRRRRVRNRVLAWLPGRTDGEADEDPLENLPDSAPLPPQALDSAAAMAMLERALEALPERQQQAFMLRTLEGLDVAATAVAMGCSAGSVKTHHFRAVQALRTALVEFGP
jgi:RNA polymerase sigma-70 factor (ECF subfamily)